MPGPLPPASVGSVLLPHPLHVRPVSPSSTAPAQLTQGWFVALGWGSAPNQWAPAVGWGKVLGILLFLNLRTDMDFPAANSHQLTGQWPKGEDLGQHHEPPPGQSRVLTPVPNLLFPCLPGDIWDVGPKSSREDTPHS